MSRKAWLALSLVFLLPLAGYFLLKYEGADAVHMPRHYFEDSVTNLVLNGKMRSDTTWHRIANITLTNQLGKQVSLNDLDGRIIIANFFLHPLSINLSRTNAKHERVAGWIKDA